MRLLNLCSVAVILSLSSFAYAQTSVCNIDKGQFCFDIGYLNDVSKQLYSSENFDKEISYKIATFGINYGLTDTIKLSVLPKMNTGSLSDVSVGFQIMHGDKIPYSYLEYFTIASGSLYSAEFTKHEDAIYDRTSGFIAGAGVYYQSDTEIGSLIVYSSCFYEGYHLHRRRDLSIISPYDPESKFKSGFSVDIGAEFKFGKDSRYILKSKYTVVGNVKEDSFDISLTLQFPESNK